MLKHNIPSLRLENTTVRSLHQHLVKPQALSQLPLVSRCCSSFIHPTRSVPTTTPQKNSQGRSFPPTFPSRNPAHHFTLLQHPFRTMSDDASYMSFLNKAN